MGTFTTKLRLGGPAFLVHGGLDPYIQQATVGQIRVIETMPTARYYSDEPCYKEEYMCIETGVGSGSVWTYGKNIFATEEEAKVGVIIKQQQAYAERAARDVWNAEQEAKRQELELFELNRLKQKYEAKEKQNETT